MTTAASDLLVEFRCSRCYQALYESVDAVGSSVQCPHCMTTTIVPEATEDRLRNAEELDSAILEQPAEPVFVDEHQNLSPAEAAALAKQRATELKVANNTGRPGVETISCSRFVRLLAKSIDGVLALMALGLSLGLGAMLAHAGYYKMPDIEEFVDYGSLDPIVFLGFASVYFLFNVLQWCLIANFGQSLGKMVFNIKIVDEEGYAPGFFQGVFLRTWVTGLIASFVPFGGMINILLIFRDPPRCGHDLLAKTYVVKGSKL